MLYNLQDLITLAEDGGFAVPAFNVYNLETAMGVARAAEKLRAPVILQIYSRLFDSPNAKYLAPSVLEIIRDLPTPAALHLDHGAGLPEVMRALRCGCTGVMLDASAYPFAENAARTRQVVELAAASGVPVEGELGHVGTVNDAEMSPFTEPEEAAAFCDATGVAALAVMVGTAHGRYKSTPKLDQARISAIRAATGASLVLHGGSGIPDDAIRESVTRGIRKVNFGTDVCYSFLDAVFATPRSLVAIDAFMKDAVSAVSAYAESKIALLGAVNRG